MSSRLPFTFAFLPFIFGLLSGVNTGCSKNPNNNPAIDTTGGPFISAVVGGVSVRSIAMTNVEDTANHRFQVQGTVVGGGDTCTLTIYFPDSVFMPVTLGFDGYTTILKYANPAKEENYYQTYGNSSGTLTISSINTTSHEIDAAFSGTVFKNGSFQDSAITVNNGSFYATYTMP